MTDPDNRHMNPDDRPDRQLAALQHIRLIKLCFALGIEPVIMDPTLGLVDQTFTRNGYLKTDDDGVDEKKAILGEFKPKRRRQSNEGGPGESPYFRNFLIAEGYTVHEMPKGVIFEGAGDARLYKDKIICTHGIRTSKDAVEHLERITGKEVVPLELVRPQDDKEKIFYHGDTMSVFLEETETAIVFTEALTAASLRRLAKHVHIIPASREDAESMALNAIVIPRSDITVNHDAVAKLSPELQNKIEEFEQEALRFWPQLRGVVITTALASKWLLATFTALGYFTITINLSEFLKSGAGPYCLTNDI